MSFRATATLLFMAALLLWAAPAQAALPALSVAKARQATLRRALKSGPPIAVSVTVLGDELQSFSAPTLRLGLSKGLELEATSAAGTRVKEGDFHLKKRPPTLSVDAKAPMPWSVVFSLLSAPDPLASLQATLGAVDPAKTKIDVLDGDFVYQYGASPRVVFSRDFSKLRRVFARADGVAWEFRLSGDLGAGGLPARVDILRAGAPFANIKLSLSGSPKLPESK